MTTDTERDLQFEDGRSDLPIFIHHELDDLPLSLEAFRVYAHLARRAGRDNLAWPSYNSMGEACFRKSYPNASADTLRRKAIAAVNELIAAGLIRKLVTCNERGEHGTNRYRLTPRHEWGGSVNTLGSVNAPRSVLTPKDTPIEDTTYEDSPEKEGREAATPPSVRPSSLPETSLPSGNGKDFQSHQTARAPSPPVATAPPSPHVAAYQDILGKTLSPAHCEQILCAAPPLPDWLVTLRVWKAADYNPVNIAGMLELAADPRRARWKLDRLEEGDAAPTSYQVDIDEAQALPFVPDTPPLADTTWAVADDPCTTFWHKALPELTQFAQLKGSTLLAGQPMTGIPVYVVQVDNELDAAWLKQRALRHIERALKAQIEGDFILEVAA